MPCRAVLGTVTTTVLHGTARHGTVRVNANRAQTAPGMRVYANHAPKPRVASTAKWLVRGAEKRR